MSEPAPATLIATILKHDRRVTSYKLALVRSLADVALLNLAAPVEPGGVAIPLRALARRWVAYYWPFADPAHPIRQGHRMASRAEPPGVLRPQRHR